MQIRPLGPVFGAEVSDVQLHALTDAQFAELRSAWVQHEVLVVRDQQLDVGQHIQFGRRFGELTVSPFSPNSDDAAELIVLDNHADSQRPLTDIWHSDETFRERPPLVTILRARIMPEFGGDTMFASMTAAYECLSARMQRYLAGTTALHGFGRFGALLRQDPERRHLLHRVENEMPMPHHPVVRVHPESGRKALFVNPHFTLKIDEIDEDESDALLRYLCSRALVPEVQLRVSWQPDTVVLWDNRSVQHYAPNDYLPQRRRMERVTVRGDVPVGDAAEDILPAPLRGIDARNVGESKGGDGTEVSPIRHFDR
jgi:taurine dioxygenase